MSNTPETDAVASPHIGFYSCATVPAEFSRRLEQERNEALAQIKELMYIGERAIALADIDFENDKFGVVSELRSDLEKVKEATQ